MSSKPFAEEEIFKVACKLGSPEARADYLRDVCGDDAALVDRLAALLRVHDEEQSFLESPPPGLAAAIEPLPVAERPGQTIGRYKLLQEIGEGGFGVVYLAEQTEPVHRKVALKIIKLGMDTKQVIARFEAERQALALMDHPNIAKVLDAGATDTGRPYFVMELVQGIRITEYCDTNKLTTKDRLRLFIDVCHAVQHAHQKGIIHRDIKPTNVMVTVIDGKPVPKVIDFGIAKATQQRLTEKTLCTHYHQFIGTPQYMSPEQASQCDEDVDTRSDIYSLGVLLYELLVGTTPFDPDELGRSSYDQICQTIREMEPVAPSKKLSTLADAITTVSERRQVQPLTLQKQLRGDLDWIVMKALEKDRARRYETANALIQDIERHLANEPVLARPPTRYYRLRKFGRKHWRSIAAVGAVLATLLVGLFVSTAMYFKAEVARFEANRQLYVSDVNSAYHAWQDGNVGRVRELLARHVPRAGQEDLRSFAWHYLWGRYQRSITSTFRTGGGINSIAFSPDGSVLAAGSGRRPGIVTLWETATHRELRQITVHSQGVECVSFSPDWNTMATGGLGTTVTLWDLATGEVRKTLTGHEREVLSVAFSPDGKTIASGCCDPLLRLWDTATGKLTNTLQGHAGAVAAISFSPDGKVLASGSFDREIRLWNAVTGEPLSTLKGHRSRVWTVAFSHNGKYLASGGRDRSPLLWNVANGEILRDFKYARGVNSVAFSPNDTLLAAGGSDKLVRLWEVGSGELIRTLRGHSEFVTCVRFSVDGMTLTSASKDGTVKFWDVDAHGNMNRQAGNVESASVAISGDGQLLAMGTGDYETDSGQGEIRLWNLSAGESRRFRVNNLPPIFSVAFVPDTRLLVTGGGHRSGPGDVRVWDLLTGKPLHILEGHASQVQSVALSPDGKTLASGGLDGVRLWDVDTRKGRVLWSNSPEFAMSIAFALDGRTFAIGGGRFGAGKTLLWDVTTGKQLAHFESPNLIVSVAFSPEGTRLASGCWDGTVTLWNLVDGNENITSVSLRNTVVNQTSLAAVITGLPEGFFELDITEMDLSGIDFVDITDLELLYVMDDLTDLWFVNTQNVDAIALDELLNNLATIESPDTEGVLYMTRANYNSFNAAGGGLLADWNLESGHHVEFLQIGDVNHDTEVNGLDADPFVDVLLASRFDVAADMNGDGAVNGLDVEPFVAAVVGGGTHQIPEPSTLLLALVTLGVIGGWRKWAA